LSEGISPNGWELVLEIAVEVFQKQLNFMSKLTSMAIPMSVVESRKEKLIDKIGG
jgi:hypothetical protein